MSMGGKMTRRIGLARTEAWWGLKNLTYNFLRYLQRTSSLAAVVSSSPSHLFPSKLRSWSELRN
jgi:hypothetical protein